MANRVVVQFEIIALLHRHLSDLASAFQIPQPHRVIGRKCDQRAVLIDELASMNGTTVSAKSPGGVIGSAVKCDHAVLVADRDRTQQVKEIEAALSNLNQEG